MPKLIALLKLLQGDFTRDKQTAVHALIHDKQFKKMVVAHGNFMTSRVLHQTAAATEFYEKLAKMTEITTPHSKLTNR